MHAPPSAGAQINVVMEYVGSQSLHQYLKSKPDRRLEESEAKRMFKQVISAVNYMHQKSIVHRDIKLENILLDDSNTNIKLIDFGFSIYIPSDKKLSIFCGTPQYMSPEIVAKKEYYGPPADVWATGILLYIMLVGQFPFKAPDEKKLYQKIQKNDFTVPNFVSAGAQHLIKKLLNPNCGERITPEQVSTEPPRLHPSAPLSCQNTLARISSCITLYARACGQRLPLDLLI